ncbi:PIN domain-containing protein [Thermococcus sp. ES12]|uniref:PIN domain-containing protein n=1 Tax=Thermococcus sp. ES12 TaxID=1638246 RepID=UPI0014307F3F|nr:PIN domain-containing protein [Thermococcus sp. ES12]
MRKLAKENYGITSPRKLKLTLNKGSIPSELIGKAYSYVKATLIANEVILVPEQVLWEDIIALAEKYRLLPSDARILATALAHEADKLATLDRDFHHVDVVTLVPGDYWIED